MNPLVLRSPAALFGADVVDDRKKLRRAYARLIRTHTPEEAPEAFQHIRAMYERALDALQQAPATPAEPAPAAVDGSVDAVIAAWLDGQADARATFAHLDALARDDDVPAGQAALAMCLGLWPDETAGWLASLPGGAAAAVHLTLAAFEGWRGLATMPELDTLQQAVAVHAPEHLAGFVHARLDALTAVDAEWLALAVFELTEPALRQHAPQAWPALLHTALRSGGWTASPETLQARLDGLGDVTLDLSDADFQNLSEMLHGQLALQAAVSRGAVPPHLARAVRTGTWARSSYAAWALAELRDQGTALADGITALCEQAPGVAFLLSEAEEGASARGRHLAAWANSGKAPRLPGERVGERAAGALGAIAELRQDQLDDVAAAGRRQALGLRRRNLAIVGAGTLAVAVMAIAVLWFQDAQLGQGRPPVQTGAFLVFAVFGVGYVLRDRFPLTHPDKLELDGNAPWTTAPKQVEADMQHRLAALLSDLGCWAHDLAGAAFELRHGWAAAPLDRLVQSRTADIQAVTDDHIRRAMIIEILDRGATEERT